MKDNPKKNTDKKPAQDAGFLLDETKKAKPYKVRDQSITKGGSYTLKANGEYVRNKEKSEVKS